MEPQTTTPIVEKPASTGVLALTGLLLVSVLLPPLGLGLTIRYLRSTDTTAKIMGIISLVLTVTILGVAIWSAIAISRNINQYLRRETSGLLGRGGFIESE